MIPQLIIIVLFAMGLAVNISRHGEQEDQKYNGWAHLFYLIINTIILYYGGFWNVIL